MKTRIKTSYVLRSVLSLLLCGANSFADMKIHEYSHLSLFQKTLVPTEYYAYQKLKKTPLYVDVTYVAVPWYQLINKNLLDTVANIKVERGFTICQHIKYPKIIPYLQKMGVSVLFATHALKQERHGDLVVMPFPHYAVTGVSPSQNKDILYSFVGARTKQIREKLFEIPLLEGCYIKKRDVSHFNASAIEKELFEKEYKDVLSRSRFSLCPRGTGPNTMRFWESLQAGAIPVVISDDLTLPEGVDWGECVVWISEAEFLRDSSVVNRAVLGISQEKENELRKNGLRAYKNFSGRNFVSVIRKFYGEK
jgi:hypothetical protein